jgi:division protein CdvB (Snf7/Vps24/ESCRT-III family)
MTTLSPEQAKSKQTNGGETPEALAVASAVQHHVASYKRMETERDEYKSKLEIAEKLIAVYKIEVEGQRAQLEVERSRIQSYQVERDDAVVRCATVEATLENIMAIGRAHQVANIPMVKKIVPPQDETDGN